MAQVHYPFTVPSAGKDTPDPEFALSYDPNDYDPLFEISMEQYYPGLIRHESMTTGASTFLLRDFPRWRGTATWGEQPRAQAVKLEMALMQIAEGALSLIHI